MPSIKLSGALYGWATYVYFEPALRLSSYGANAVLEPSLTNSVELLMKLEIVASSNGEPISNHFSLKLVEDKNVLSTK